MLDGLTYEDSESPAIGLVPAGVSWEEVQNHVKIAHHPLLVLLDASGQYVGAYWTGTSLVVSETSGRTRNRQSVSSGTSCVITARHSRA